MAELVVRGTLSVAIDATQAAETFFSGIANSTRTEILDLVNGANSAISGVSSTIDKIPGCARRRAKISHRPILHLTLLLFVR
jgi:hypothetical protein